MTGSYLDILLFGILPYVAFFTFFLVTVSRYRSRKFTYSSLSSQFLENQQHFWGIVPLHYGILTVLTGHLVAFLIPRQILWWNSQPLRLYILEISALVFGLLALIGLTGAIARRCTVSKVKQVTSVRDWVLHALLALQVTSGIGVALFHPWGSSWYAAVAVPYLWSVARFAPNVTAIGAMPAIVKFHIANAYALILFAPFTRLVHILVAPNPYLWRKPQVVRWYRTPGAATR